MLRILLEKLRELKERPFVIALALKAPDLVESRLGAIGSSTLPGL
jgi:hypothetical protein